MAQWHFIVKGQQYGPADDAQMRNWLAQSAFPPDTLVWRAGMPEWLPASRFPELFASNEETAPLPSRGSDAPPQSPYAARMSQPIELPDDEWGVIVDFAGLDNIRWHNIFALGRQYENTNAPPFPPLQVSPSTQQFRFSLGRSAARPAPAFKDSPAHSAAVRTLWESCLAAAAALHKQGLGIWRLDIEAAWKMDNRFITIPQFWLPVTGAPPDSRIELPPECAEAFPVTPSAPADIYAIALFCRQALLGKRFDPYDSRLPGDINPEWRGWDHTLDSALRRNPARRPVSFAAWMEMPPELSPAPPSPRNAAVTETSAPSPALETREAADSWGSDETSVTERSKPRRSIKKRVAWRKWAVLTVVVITFIGIGRIAAPGVMRMIPGISLFAPSYQRGLGSYVVRYANRSYEGLQWKQVWSTEFVGGGARLYRISGWDADNFAIATTAYMVARSPVFRQGHWVILEPRISERPYYLDKKNFMTIQAESITLIGETSKTSRGRDFSNYRVYSSFFQTADKSVYYAGYFGDLFRYEQNELHKYENSDKQTWIWRDNNSNTKRKVAEIRVVSAFANGRALGCYYWVNPNEYRIAEFKDGLWYDLRPTSFEVGRNDGRAHMWAMDSRNFILAGYTTNWRAIHSNLTTIVQVRDGVESSPVLSVMGWSFTGGYAAVWGVSMDKYWVMDIKGNIAEFSNGQFRGVVRGMKLEEDRILEDAWVAPDGTVFAITDKEVYRLG